MSSAEPAPSKHIDASVLSVDQLHLQLDSLPADATVTICNCQPEHTGLLSGWHKSLHIHVEGNLGAYGFLAAQDVAAEVSGNTAIACAHSIRSGSVLIRGDAAHYLAAYGQGGYVAVHGRAGDYAGYCLSGADVLIRSRCGNGAGAAMQSGTLVLGNGCGNDLGYGMSGGVIYVRGDVGSVAEHVQASRLKEADTIRLSLMLVRAGIKTTYERFQVFRAKGDRP